MKDVMFKGNSYTVTRVTNLANASKNNYIITEIATGNKLKRFTKSGLAIAMAKGLDEGTMGWNGWTPAFIARDISF